MTPSPPATAPHAPLARDVPYDPADHLSETFAVRTADGSLSGPVLRFVRSVVSCG